MKWVPFTAHIRIVPANPGKRLENWRDMQKLSAYIYEGLEAISPSTINIAQPGGGQHKSYGGAFGANSGLVYGCAAKPQFGETPAQLQINGYYNSDNANIQPHPDLTRIHAGEVREGSVSHSCDSVPTSTIGSEVKSLKNAMETAINNSIPAGINYSIFRLEYSGTIFGDRGYHFPR